MSFYDKWQEGDALLSKGALDLAAQCFQEVLGIDPAHKQANHSLGLIALNKDDPTTAVAFFIKALETDPCWEDAVLNLWRAYERLGEKQQMVPLLKQLVQQCSNAEVFQRLLQEATVSRLEDPIPAASSGKTERKGRQAWSMSPEVFVSQPDKKAKALLQEAQAQLNAGAHDLAATSLWRCCVITKFADLNIVQALAQIYQQKQDIRALQTLWKRAAVSALEGSDYSAFLQHAYVSIYAEQFYAKDPNYEYAFIDEDLNVLTRFAARSHPLSNWVSRNRVEKSYVPGEGRLKVGFVLEGYSQLQAPSRQYIPFAEHHDPDRFELFFYSRHPMGTPLAVKEGYVATRAILEQAGCRVWTPAEQLAPMDQVEALAKRIVQDRIDLLVYQTMYFVPPYNFLSYLHTAPFQAAIEHQQPEFSQALDLVFAPRKAGLDSVCEVAPFPMAYTKTASGAAHHRTDFGIPEAAVVLISANRDVRYAQDLFWQELTKLLERHPNVYFIALGLSDAPAVLSAKPALRACVITPGFRTDVPACLAAADLYIDLFPSGGGSSIVEAMSLGLPVVCFEQDYATPYAVNEEILSEYVDEPTLVVPHGQYAAWHDVLDRLIQDPALRKRMRAEMLRRAKAFEPQRVSDRFFRTLEEAFYRRVSEA